MIPIPKAISPFFPLLTLRLFFFIINVTEWVQAGGAERINCSKHQSGDISDVLLTAKTNNALICASELSFSCA